MNGREENRKQEDVKKVSLSSCLPFYGRVACFFVVFGLGFPLLSKFGTRTIQENFPFIHQAVQTRALEEDGLRGFLLERWPILLKALCYGIYIQWFVAKLLDGISRARKVRL